MDPATVALELQILQSLAGNYRSIDAFNCNELEMFWKIESCRTICTVSLAGKKAEIVVRIQGLL